MLRILRHSLRDARGLFRLPKAEKGHEVNPAKKALMRRSARIPDRYPHFLVIGATRSGTTSLNHILGSHPQVYVPYNREIHYFDRNDRFRSDLKGYRELMAGHSGESIIGDVTPSYWRRNHVDKHNGGEVIDPMSRISSTIPHVKLLISLRDPIERARSNYRKRYLSGQISGSFDECLRLERRNLSTTNFILSAQYHININHVLSFFLAKVLKFSYSRSGHVIKKDIFRTCLRFLALTPITHFALQT